MALTHRKANTSEPLRPILGQRLKPTGRGSARRVLSFLGSNNRKANLRLAESLLTISQSEFRTKWNFDPIAETPLSQGQFLWTPVKPTLQVSLLVDVKLTTTARPKTDLEMCFELPHKEVITKFNDENTKCNDSENGLNLDMIYIGQLCKEARCLSVKETSIHIQLCPDSEDNNSLSINKQLCPDSENNNSLSYLSINKQLCSDSENNKSISMNKQLCANG
ncbi:unnamed protein product [Meganyctiphanes norvegica]|uniref:Cyclin-dependent kinase inhibitor domain-containing protein n=1 Tax=Meganyctiphanes norvegica TaxID=48144 RepID=A0AAV2PZX8_MEGNR